MLQLLDTIILLLWGQITKEAVVAVEMKEAPKVLRMIFLGHLSYPRHDLVEAQMSLVDLSFRFTSPRAKQRHFDFSMRRQWLWSTKSSVIRNKSQRIVQQPFISAPNRVRKCIRRHPD